MASESYGVVKGRVVGGRPEWRNPSPHYQLHLLAGDIQLRVAINVRSHSDARQTADLLFALIPDLRHPLVSLLPTLPDGFTPLDAGAPLALDYVRGGLVAPTDLRLAHAHRPGPDNDLNDLLHGHLRRTAAHPESRVYAWGMRWGPEPDEPDDVFGFLPGDGLHNVHMNQGSRDRHAAENAPRRDGGLILWHAGEGESDRGRWVGLFLAFQSQTWQTDVHGHPIVGGPRRPSRQG